MVVGDILQRLFQQRQVHFLAGLQQESLVPMLGVGQRLLEEPALDRGEQHRAGQQGWTGFGRRRVGAETGHAGQGGDRLVLEKLAQVQLQPGLVGTRDHLDAQDRIAAQLEEIVVDADLLQAKQLNPDICQSLLGRAVRGAQAPPAGYVFALADRLDGRQCPPVNLSIGRQRQLGHKGVGGRQHVGRQLLAQRPAELSSRQISFGARHDIRHQALGVRPGRASRLDQDRCIQYPRLLAQLALDLFQLHPVAADFHLLVDPPQELQSPIGAIARQVPSAVHALPGLVAKGVRQQALGGQVGPVVITAHHPGAPDVQLAGHTYRHRLQAAVQHIQPGVGDGPANRHGRRQRIPGRGFKYTAAHHRFGWPILIDEARPGRVLHPIGQGLAQQSLATDDEAPHRHMGGIAQPLAERLQVRRGQLYQAQVGRVQQRFAQRFHARLFGQQKDGPPGQQWGEHAGDGQVEADR